MVQPATAGWIVVLNGPPRSGKSTIAAAIQNALDGIWLNLGVDLWMQATPERFRPGIGLRPGGERPDLEPLVALLYRGLYESIAAQSRLGLNVVADVGHHDAYATIHGILPACARILTGLPALLVGVRCPLETIMERRQATGWNADWTPGSPVPAPVLRWQEQVHRPGQYDLEVDTSLLTPAECAEAIRRRITNGPAPTAFARLADLYHQSA